MLEPEDVLEKIFMELKDIRAELGRLSAGAAGASERRDHVTILEAARLAAVSPRTIEHMLTKGSLTRIKFGARTLIDRRELESRMLTNEPDGGNILDISSRILDSIRGSQP